MATNIFSTYRTGENRITAGATYKVMLLTAPDDPRTLVLDHPVVNDLRSDARRTVAFTQNQRHVSSEALMKATRTSDLVDGS